MKKVFAFVLSFCLTAAAHASVIYTWQADNDKAPLNIDLQMIFTDAAVAKGHLNLQIDYSQVTGDPGLLFFYYTLSAQRLPVVFSPPAGAQDANSHLKLNLQFEQDAWAVSGSIDTYNIENSISLSSDGPLFTVTAANSDAGMLETGCASSSNCAGATGHFLATRLPGGEVPEPGQWPIVGAGLVALFQARRFRHKRAA